MSDMRFCICAEVFVCVCEKARASKRVSEAEKYIEDMRRVSEGENQTERASKRERAQMGERARVSDSE